MRRVLVLVLIVCVTVMVIGVVVFRHSLGLTWVEAVYFVVTTVTTVGYGDISLQGASPGVKLFGSFLMVAGAASMAATIGILIDALMRSNLQEIFGRRRRRMRDHIVLCGLGNVGFRVLEQLGKLGERVIVVEQDEGGKFLNAARAQGVPVVVGDIRLAATLDQAHIQQARCLIAATDDDLANLEAALNARAARGDIRLVLRMFDQRLASKLQLGFGIHTAFSTSALAAPAFAMAAVDPAVIGSFYVGDDLMLNLQITVAPDSTLATLTTADLEAQAAVSVLAHQSAATGERQLHPSQPVPLEPGDRLVVATLPEFRPRLHEMNAPG